MTKGNWGQNDKRRRGSQWHNELKGEARACPEPNPCESRGKSQRRMRVNPQAIGLASQGPLACQVLDGLTFPIVGSTVNPRASRVRTPKTGSLTSATRNLSPMDFLPSISMLPMATGYSFCVPSASSIICFLPGSNIIPKLWATACGSSVKVEPVSTNILSLLAPSLPSMNESTYICPIEFIIP